MKTFNQNFTASMGMKSSSPSTLVVFHFSGGDVCLSDRHVRAGDDGPEFKGLVTSWGPIVNKGSGLFSISVPELELTIANTGEFPFSRHLEDSVPEDTEVEVFQWFEGLSYEEKEPLGKFNIASPVEYTESMVKLKLVGAFGRRDRVVGSVITRETYPYADPDCIGMAENIIYGSPKGVLCHPVIAGAATTLAVDVTAAQTSGIELSMLPGETAFPAQGTLQMDNEKITYTGVINRVLTGVIRGASGTQTAAHKKGASTLEVRNDYTYLVAGHPVKSIGDVYVGGVRVVSGATRYTDSVGKAKIVFSDRFTLEKAVSLSVSTGNHSHQTRGVTAYAQGTSGVHYPSTGVTWSGYDSSMYDGGKTGPKLHGDSTNWPSGNYMRVNFPAWTGGTIRNVKVCLTYEKYLSIGSKTIKFQGHELSDTGEITTVRFDNGTAYPSSVQCIADSGHSGYIDIYEMWLEVEADTVTSAADGVALTGSSAADVIIGGDVTCDVEGLGDDASGTYTGTPVALIENPADVIRHFLVTYLDMPQGEAGPSFDTTRAGLSQAIPGGYRFAGVIANPVAAFGLITAWSAQSRLKLGHDGYHAWLRLLPNQSSTPDKALGKAALKAGSLVVGRTGTGELINRLTVHYRPDHSRRTGLTGDYMEAVDASDAYPAGGDPASVAAYGPRCPARPYLFGFVTDGAMAFDLRDFYIARFKDVKRHLAFSVFLDNLDIEEGDIVGLDYTSPAFDISGALFYVEDTAFMPGSAVDGRPDQMRVTAREV